MFGQYTSKTVTQWEHCKGTEIEAKIIQGSHYVKKRVGSSPFIDSVVAAFTYSAMYNLLFSSSLSFQNSETQQWTKQGQQYPRL